MLRRSVADCARARFLGTSVAGVPQKLVLLEMELTLEE